MNNLVDVCADCSASAPQWASVNRAVLLCDDCASIHRQLGRHISQVKHLKKSRWRTSQLDMIHYLVAAGANRYWEHVLYEPMLTGKQAGATDRQNTSITTAKPKPTDPLHPVKTEFIREKYLFLGFFKKPRNINPDDLNQQLHASVRTGVLETSLYLLALGANPNFVHPTKGTSPMHVACQYNQLGQVEVLLAYGADVCIRDSCGQTPIDIALDRALSSSEHAGSNGSPSLWSVQQKLRLAWSPLVDTLVSAYYEVTDGLAYFLCRSVPNHRSAVLGTAAAAAAAPSPVVPAHTDSGHKATRSTAATNGLSAGAQANGLNGRHFLISTSVLPNDARDDALNSRLRTPEDWIGKARYRLQQLPNLAFEDLCIDVYDEADRRLTNSFLETLDCSMTERRAPNNGALSADTSCAEPKRGSAVCHDNQSLTLYFLPPNTAYSSVRNQARQKLGRLSTVEFHTLVQDILTEVSARLLPLFSPSSSTMQSPSGPDVVSGHPPFVYSDRGTVAMPTSVSARLTPLPSPPLVEPASDNDTRRPSDSITEPTTPVTNVSSSTSVGEPEAMPATTPERLGNAGTRAKASHGGENKGRLVTGRGDDPVYDQVATESDANSLSTNGTSVTSYQVLSPTLQSCSPTGPNPPSSARNESDGNVDSSEHSSTSTDKPSTDQVEDNGGGGGSSSSSNITNTGCLPLSIATDPSITSCPGPLPGSRRLHLSHTGRINQHHHRASVPSTHTISTSNSETGFPLSPVVEAADLAIDSNPQARLQSSTIRNESPVTPLTPPNSACCVAARNEVDRLRKENSELRAQLTEFQASTKSMESRLRTLESKMLETDAMIGSLKKERSALQAALSAATQPKPVQVDNAESQTDLPKEMPWSREGAESSAPHHPSPIEDHKEQTAVCGQTDGSSNYSIGSQFLDSGMLLRQGIVLRSSRGGSPASLTGQSDSSAPTGLAANPPPARLSRASELPAGPNPAGRTVTSYVNLPPIMPKPVMTRAPVSKPQWLGTAHNPAPSSWNATPGSHSASTSNDYAAPNSTGSASPAPLQVASSTASPAHLEPDSSRSRTVILTQSVQTPHARSVTSVTTHHDLVLGNRTAEPGPHQPGLGEASNPPVRNGTPTRWQGPSSELVVRCVESIIGHIRNLVLLANGDRSGDFARCSASIESAVQDLLHLFPSLGSCPPDVRSALTELASASHGLQPQRTCPSAQTGSHPDMNVVIRHAHRIAKAAKELLSIFQQAAA